MSDPGYLLLACCLLWILAQITIMVIFIGGRQKKDKAINSPDSDSYDGI